MIQAIGLTSRPRRHQLRPAVDDLTFEACPGRVTVLLGSEGSGKTTALRLMLQLTDGRGTALFRGRPVHRIPHPAREVGVLLGEMNGHPGRTVRGHLRMLAAAAGVPAGRADDVLDVVGLSGLADQRTGTLSRGMDRRMAIACALIGDPHTLVLDEPADGLSPREATWLYSLLRGYAHEGGTVLVTSGRSEETARLADRVVSIACGRLVADQEAADFARTRLRPRVAVHTPYAERLVAVLAHEGRKAGRDRDVGPLKAVRESGTRVSVYGSTCAEVGELAYRHGILVHRLSDERGDAGDAHTPGPLDRADGRRTARATTEDAETPPQDGPEPPELTAEQVLLECEELEELEDLDELDPAQPAPATGGASGGTEPGGDDQGEAGPTDDTPAERHTDPVLVTASARTSADEADQTAPDSSDPAEPSPAPTATEPTSSTADSTPTPTPPTELTKPTELAKPTGPTGTSATTATTATAATTATPEPSCPLPADGADDPEAPTVPISDTPLSAAAPGPGQVLTTDPTSSPASTPTPKSPPPPWTPSTPPAQATAAAELPPQLHAVPRPGPAAPLRYELLRITGLRSTWTVLALTLGTALCLALVMAGTGTALPPASAASPARPVRMLTGWPYGGLLPLPPAAFAAGLLGALAFGEEFRHPALAPARSPVARRVSLLAAKLAVSGTLAVLLSAATAILNAAAVALLFGPEALAFPAEAGSAQAAASTAGLWRLHIAAVVAFAVGAAWAGVLAAGVFRSGLAGTAAVLAIPLLVTPVVRTVLGGAPAGDGATAATDGSITGLPARLETALLMPWPPGTARWLAALVELASQPLGCALALALALLFAGYFATVPGRRAG